MVAPDRGYAAGPQSHCNLADLQRAPQPKQTHCMKMAEPMASLFCPASSAMTMHVFAVGVQVTIITTR